MRQRKDQNSHPVHVPTLMDALTSNSFLEQLTKNDFSFVASDYPELSAAISNAFRIVTHLAIRDKFRKIGGENLKKGSKASQDRAKLFAENMKPILESLDQSGYKSIRSKVWKLNYDKVATPSGKGQWHISTLQAVKKKIKSKPNPKPD